MATTQPTTTTCTTRPPARPLREPLDGPRVAKGTMPVAFLTFPTKATATDAPRTFRFIASTGEADRVGDRILVSSWQLAGYKKNPVILVQHRSTELPVGRARNVWTTADALMVDVEFLPDNMNPEADKVRALVASGYLSGVSVGFRPGPSRPNSFGGRDFLFPVDLTEISIVTVPMNSSCVVHGRASKDAILKWVRGATKDPIVFTLKDAPEPRYSVTDTTARAFVQALHATFTSAAFRQQLRQVVDVRVERAMKTLRGKLD